MKLTRDRVLDLLKSEHVMTVNGIYRVTVGDGKDGRPALFYGIPTVYESEELMSVDDATDWKVHYNDADGCSHLSCVINGGIQQVCTLLFAPRTQWELEMHVHKYTSSEETNKLCNARAELEEIINQTK